MNGHAQTEAKLPERSDSGAATRFLIRGRQEMARRNPL